MVDKDTIIKLISLFASVFIITSCASIKPVGNLGPKKLNVYAISHSDFLSASRMIVVLNDKGDVVAFSGSTVSGAGTVGLQTGAALATAGAIAYGAKSISNSIQNANVNVKGIPSRVDVHGVADININT
jgi:hypothetical protein